MFIGRHYYFAYVFIQNFSSLEQKWIVRVILKDLEIGIRHERVSDVDVMFIDEEPIFSPSF